MITQLAQQLCGVSPGEPTKRSPSLTVQVMYFSTRILTPVFKDNSKYIALLVLVIKIPMTLAPALVVKVRLSFP